MDEFGYEASPAGLVARAQSRPIVAMKIFIEEELDGYINHNHDLRIDGKKCLSYLDAERSSRLNRIDDSLAGKVEPLRKQHSGLLKRR